MLSTKHAAIVRNILLWIVIAAVAFYAFNVKLPNSEFVKDSIESVEDSKTTVTRLSAAALSLSVAITMFPDDVATSLADKLADMSTYFLLVLIILYLERILILYGFKFAAFALPAACIMLGFSFATKREGLKNLASKLIVLILALTLVVPCSTHLTNYLAKDLQQYVEATIVSTEDGAEKVHEVMEVDEDEKTIFEKLSEAFKTAIHDVSDMLLHFQNDIRRYLNSAAIMLLTNCVMPVLNFFLLKWVLKETFNIVIPTPKIRRKRHPDSDSDSDSNSDSGLDAGAPGNELIVAGE